MRVLYVASVVKIHIAVFHIPYLKMLKENGCETHVCAANDYASDEVCSIPYCDRYYDIPFKRNPFNFQNIKAYFLLKKIINENQYDIIHCHTPIGGVLARLASVKTRKRGTKVFYTAHGFHFFKGSSLKNWLLYYPVEKWLSRLTDTLITLNKEDYDRSLKFNSANAVLINGVGIETKEFGLLSPDGRTALRKSMGIDEDDRVLMCVGELTKRKHQDFLIGMVADLVKRKPALHLVLVGGGDSADVYKKLAKELNIERNVHFLGFRSNIKNLLCIADVYVSSSRQEGLPVNIMEAMASGLAIVSFEIRGNKELIINRKGGYLVEVDNFVDFKDKLVLLLEDTALTSSMAAFNRNRIHQYETSNIVNEIKRLYEIDA